MSPEEFLLKLEQFTADAEVLVSSGLPVIIGRKASHFFTENFQNESFTDNAPDKWQEVKRREDPRAKGAKGTRKILTGETADLGESITWDVTAPGEVTVKSDKPYAQAHNEGTTNAGRSRNVVIPKRQFIGDSNKLNDLITDEIDRKLNDLFK